MDQISKINLPIFAFLISVAIAPKGAAAPEELPNTSYPLTGRYARCEEGAKALGAIGAYLSNDHWAYQINLGSAFLAEDASQKVPFTLDLRFHSREFKCIRDEENPRTYRWIPLVQDPTNAVHIHCKEGRFNTTQKMVRYQYYHPPTPDRKFEYVDRWSSVSTFIPLQSCLSKEGLQRFNSGESVDVVIESRYRPRFESLPPFHSGPLPLDFNRWLPGFAIYLKVSRTKIQQIR